jgi:hypothetical protein
MCVYKNQQQQVVSWLDTTQPTYAADSLSTYFSIKHTLTFTSTAAANCNTQSMIAKIQP